MSWGVLFQHIFRKWIFSKPRENDLPISNQFRCRSWILVLVMRTRTDLSSVLRVVSLVYLLHNFQKYPGKNTYVNIRLFPNWILKRLLTGHFGRHVVFLVVSQVYETDVNKEYTIRGNSAILKCQIPSFVADFVSVISWHTDQDEVFTYQTEDGNYVYLVLWENSFSLGHSCDL